MWTSVWVERACRIESFFPEYLDDHGRAFKFWCRIRKLKPNVKLFRKRTSVSRIFFLFLVNHSNSFVNFRVLYKLYIHKKKHNFSRSQIRPGLLPPDNQLHFMFGLFSTNCTFEELLFISVLQWTWLKRNFRDRFVTVLTGYIHRHNVISIRIHHSIRSHYKWFSINNHRRLLNFNTRIVITVCVAID